VSGVDYDGTYTASVNGDTYVAASDNQSDKKINVSVVPVDGLEIEADMDAVRGTTTGSDVVGYYMSILTSDSAQLDESTSSSSSEQFLIVKNHPSDTSKTIVKCVELQSYN